MISPAKTEADALRWIAVLTCLLSSVLAVAHADENEQPNIVFILADDVGIEPLGCYGGSSFKTPNLDRLAASGMKFDYCFSMPVCHPTRVCFLTGRYPRHIGNPAWGSFPRQLEQQTIARVMQSAGYATAVAGKWQLALLSQDLQQPHRMGFDNYCLFGWHEGPRYHDPLIFQNGQQLNGTAGKYGPDLYVEFLADFFRRHRERPFFAFYSMALCHDVTDDLNAPVPYVPGRDRYLNYGEMVASMDECVGRIVDVLDELQLRQKTWIVFTGDNGTAKGSIIRAQRDASRPNDWRYIRDPVFCQFDGRTVPGGKGNLTDSGTRVPLLVSRPGTLAGGQTVDDLVDCSDFFATFAQLGRAQMPQPTKLDSISFAPRLTGTGSAARSWAYAERGNQYWVRTQRFKLTSSGRLIDLQKSPAEAEALTADELNSAAATAHRQLSAALQSVSK